ncbi:hypothetical protein HK100_002860 [Physocladia obscura]|uniref:Uncharacterized protein n=1 Tax=Physocladia obscura TaxID=109957 RepID=A0AAD5SXQ4_9FUNG|nr:hypothetical protein HK100_002860 [Physocladia obscura]
MHGALVLVRRTSWGEYGDELGVAVGCGGGALPVPGAGVCVGLGRCCRHAEFGVLCAGGRAELRVVRSLQRAADAGVRVGASGVLRLIARKRCFWTHVAIFTGCNFFIQYSFAFISIYLKPYVTPYGFYESSYNVGVEFAGGGIMGLLLTHACFDGTKGRIQNIKYLVVVMVLGVVSLYVDTLQYIGAVTYIVFMFLGHYLNWARGLRISSETTSTGILMMVSQFISITLFAVTHALVDPTTNQQWRETMMIIPYGMILILSYLMQPHYKFVNRRLVLENYAKIEREQLILSVRVDSAIISSK